MTDYVEIVWRRNRGWPWPEDSWGLTPMYGEDGWCPVCGVPQHSQRGPLVLQKRGLTPVGAWVPHWQSDAYCLEESLRDRGENLGLVFREVASPSGDLLDAVQVMIQPSEREWFDPAQLTRRIESVHSVAGEACPACGVWKWMPVGMDILPPPPPSLLADTPPVIASPEWFGAGYASFRQIVWRRDVAEFLIDSGPKDFRLQEIRSN